MRPFTLPSLRLPRAMGEPRLPSPRLPRAMCEPRMLGQLRRLGRDPRPPRYPVRPQISRLHSPPAPSYSVRRSREPSSTLPEGALVGVPEIHAELRVLQCVPQDPPKQG